MRGESCLRAEASLRHPSPAVEGMLAQRRVVVAAVARHLHPKEGRTLEWLVGTGKFYLGHHQTLVFAKELVDLEHVVSYGYEPALLVDDAWLAQGEQREGFVEGDFLFKLVAREAAVARGAFDGEVTLVGTQPYAHRAAAAARQVALPDACARGGEVLVVAADQEFTFYL